MKKANGDIRIFAFKNEVKHWQIAAALKMDQAKFSRMLRTELSQEEKEKIFKIIEELKTEEN